MTKIYQGGALSQQGKKPEKIWPQVMGICVLVPMLVGMIMVFLAM